jgi:hypothetical protein
MDADAIRQRFGLSTAATESETIREICNHVADAANWQAGATRAPASDAVKQVEFDMARCAICDAYGLAFYASDARIMSQIRRLGVDVLDNLIGRHQVGLAAKAVTMPSAPCETCGERLASAYSEAKHVARALIDLACGKGPLDLP